MSALPNLPDDSDVPAPTRKPPRKRKPAAAAPGNPPPVVPIAPATPVPAPEPLGWDAKPRPRVHILGSDPATAPRRPVRPEDSAGMRVWVDHTPADEPGTPAAPAPEELVDAIPPNAGTPDARRWLWWAFTPGQGRLLGAAGALFVVCCLISGGLLLQAARTRLAPAPAPVVRAARPAPQPPAVPATALPAPVSKPAVSAPAPALQPAAPAPPAAQPPASTAAPVVEVPAAPAVRVDTIHVDAQTVVVNAAPVAPPADAPAAKEAPAPATAAPVARATPVPVPPQPDIVDSANVTGGDKPDFGPGSDVIDSANRTGGNKPDFGPGSDIIDSK